jgi:hypothetical protein
MTQVQPARREMLPEISRLFDPGWSAPQKEAWVKKYLHPIFDSPWRQPDEAPGQVMISNGSIVGFLGAYCSRRLIGGRVEKFCNLASWMVAQPHRNESLAMLSTYLKMKDYTITGFTPAKHVYAIYKRLGFVDLETKVAIVPILSLLPASFKWCQVTHDPDEISRCLTEGERKIFADHQGFAAAFHLLARAGGEHCHLIYTLSRKRRMQVAYVHYASNKVFLSSHLAAIAWGLFRRHGALFTCVEDRHLAAPQPWLKKYFYLNPPRIFRSRSVAANDVDNLYSELIAADVFAPYFY